MSQQQPSPVLDAIMVSGFPVNKKNREQAKNKQAHKRNVPKWMMSI
tara:strand:- start:328 stop:465 length:138 start_codon:yes stop_codon:yes gene_type:complete